MLVDPLRELVVLEDVDVLRVLVLGDVRPGETDVGARLEKIGRDRFDDRRSPSSSASRPSCGAGRAAPARHSAAAPRAGWRSWMLPAARGIRGVAASCRRPPPWWRSRPSEREQPGRSVSSPQVLIDAALSMPAVTEAAPSQIAGAVSPLAMRCERSGTGMRAT